jgi:hypothetical protein
MPLEAENLGMLTTQKNVSKEIQRVSRMVAVAGVNIYGMFLLSIMP